MQSTIHQTKPRLAFAGTGWIGLNRMRTLVGGNACIPVAIAEPAAENARKAMEIIPDAILCRSLDEVLAIRPDGIVIATPSALHAEQSIMAMNMGIAVFCQKPLGRTAVESRKIIEAARVNNKLLGVDLSYRYTDGMRKIYSMAQENKLGKIYAADLIFHNAYGPDKAWFHDPELSGGGCLIDLGTHLVDLAMWVLGFPDIRMVASSLFSKGMNMKDVSGRNEDFASAQLETTDGTLIRLACSWNLPAGEDAVIKASFYGTKAAAIFSNTGGSFYDFEARLCHGTSSEIISSPPDNWGGRALADWSARLSENPGYDSSIEKYCAVAGIIDMIYSRNSP